MSKGSLFRVIDTFTENPGSAEERDLEHISGRITRAFWDASFDTGTPWFVSGGNMYKQDGGAETVNLVFDPSDYPKIGAKLKSNINYGHTIWGLKYSSYNYSVPNTQGRISLIQPTYLGAYSLDPFLTSIGMGPTTSVRLVSDEKIQIDSAVASTTAYGAFTFTADFSTSEFVVTTKISAGKLSIQIDGLDIIASAGYLISETPDISTSNFQQINLPEWPGLYKRVYITSNVSITDSVDSDNLKMTFFDGAAGGAGGWKIGSI